MKLLAALLGMGLVFSSSAASAQSIGPSATVEVWDGGLLTEPVHPQVAIDSLGRFHVVWAHFTREDEDNRPQFTDFYNIYYTLFTIDGARVTGPTQISDRFDFIETLKPQIAVSGSNTVYVGWHSRTNGIRLIGLNPAAGNNASKPTPLAQIQRFPELDSFTDSETGGNPSNHIYIATDSTGRVHVLIEEQGERFYCAVYNADGTMAEPLRQVLGNLAGHDNGTSSVSIRMDDSDRMHIVNVFEGTNNNEVAYALVDCATGATLIDTTLVSPDDMVSSMQPTMELIAGIVYIVWIDSDVAEASCSTLRFRQIVVVIPRRRSRMTAPLRTACASSR